MKLNFLVVGTVAAVLGFLSYSSLPSKGTELFTSGADLEIE